MMQCLKKLAPFECRCGIWLKRDDLWSPDGTASFGSNARRMASAFDAFKTEIAEEHSGLVWMKPKTPKELLEFGLAAGLAGVKPIAVLGNRSKGKEWQKALGESGTEQVQSVGRAMDARQAIAEAWKLRVEDAFWQAGNAPALDILIVPCTDGMLAAGIILAVESGAPIKKVIAVQTDGGRGKEAIKRIIGECDIDRIGEMRHIPEWRVEICRDWRKSKKVAKEIGGLKLDPLREAKAWTYAENWLSEETKGKTVGLWIS